MGRAPCIRVSGGLNKGPWTAEEDAILTAYIKENGEGNWWSLTNAAGLSRCRKSCRLRWMNYLRPDLKRGNFSPDEDELIIKLHNLLGNRWSLIAGRIPGRTDNEIKNYWNSRLKRKINSLGADLLGQAVEATPLSCSLVKESDEVKAKVKVETCSSPMDTKTDTPPTSFVTNSASESSKLDAETQDSSFETHNNAFDFSSTELSDDQQSASAGPSISQGEVYLSELSSDGRPEEGNCHSREGYFPWAPFDGFDAKVVDWKQSYPYSLESVLYQPGESANDLSRLGLTFGGLQDLDFYVREDFEKCMRAPFSCISPNSSTRHVLYAQS